VRRRGHFDASDYAFSNVIRDAGEILRGSNKPMSLEALARSVGRASHLPGDARRAAFQIEGYEDNQERGWVLLTIEALKVLKRARVIAQEDDGYRWIKEGPDPIVVKSLRGTPLSIYTPEGRAKVEAEAERRLRLTPNPFTATHLSADQPLIREKEGNLPGRFFDRTHADTRDLRESLLHFGYIPELRILVDENEFVLDGRTRVKLCEELRAEFPERTDLTPTQTIVRLGAGAEANARRLKIALASNVGRRNLSTETKREVALYLYSERNWTYEQIGEALSVTPMTAQRLTTKARKDRGLADTQAERGGRGKKGTGFTSNPEWQKKADPIIERKLLGEISQEEAIAQIKALGLRASKGSVNSRQKVLEGKLPPPPPSDGDPTPTVPGFYDSSPENGQPSFNSPLNPGDPSDDMETPSSDPVERLRQAARALVEDVRGDGFNQPDESDPDPTLLLVHRDYIDALENALTVLEEHLLPQ